MISFPMEIFGKLIQKTLKTKKVSKVYIFFLLVYCWTMYF